MAALTQIFKIPDSIKKGAKYSFCPGCDHGVAVRLVGEALDELGLRERIRLRHPTEGRLQKLRG